MSPVARRVLAFLLLATAASALTNCSKKTDKPIPVQVFAREDADDIAQMVGAHTAVDSGGWFIEIESSRDDLVYRAASRIALDPGATPLRLAGAWLAQPFAVARDTSILQAGITYAINYTYTDSELVSHDTYVPNTESIEGVVLTSGMLSLARLQETFHYHDSLFGIDSVAVGNNHLVFHDGLDSTNAIVLLSSQFRTATTRFQLEENLFLDEVLMNKNPTAGRWPVSGTAFFLITANVLDSASPTAIVRAVDAEVEITFDGTQTPLARVADVLDEPTALYRYRINLKSGEIQRAP